MKVTDIGNPDYFHKVVDCQWGCPSHTPVPEYIRLIAQERYTEAFMVNWESNVFPGILGRTCDRPCEPVCRRVRTEEKPVAICRLKRVAADHKGDIRPYLPAVPKKKNGKRIALLGAGPASLAVARDLLPLGYEIDMFDRDPAGGGMMRSQIPAFRLPAEVLEEEVDLILDMGVKCALQLRDHEHESEMLDMGYDAYFVGTGAPRGRDLDLPGRLEVGRAHIHRYRLAVERGVRPHRLDFRQGDRHGRRQHGDGLLPHLQAASGPTSVTVVVRSAFDVMKASDWEKEEAMRREHSHRQQPAAERVRARQRQAEGHRVRAASNRCWTRTAGG